MTWCFLQQFSVLVTYKCIWILLGQTYRMLLCVNCVSDLVIFQRIWHIKSQNLIYFKYTQNANLTVTLVYCNIISYKWSNKSSILSVTFIVTNTDTCWLKSVLRRTFLFWSSLNTDTNVYFFPLRFYWPLRIIIE